MYMSYNSGHGVEAVHISGSGSRDSALTKWPGGRRDNDFMDYREIPQLRTSFLHNHLSFAGHQKYLRMMQKTREPHLYLDNQFRLLREDMSDDMRKEVQIAMGTQQGVHR